MSTHNIWFGFAQEYEEKNTWYLHLAKAVNWWNLLYNFIFANLGKSYRIDSKFGRTSLSYIKIHCRPTTNCSEKGIFIRVYTVSHSVRTGWTLATQSLDCSNFRTRKGLPVGVGVHISIYSVSALSLASSFILLYFCPSSPLPALISLSPFLWETTQNNPQVLTGR